MSWPPSAAIGFFAALLYGIIVAPKVVLIWGAITAVSIVIAVLIVWMSKEN